MYMVTCATTLSLLSCQIDHRHIAVFYTKLQLVLTLYGGCKRIWIDRCINNKIKRRLINVLFMANTSRSKQVLHERRHFVGEQRAGRMENKTETAYSHACQQHGAHDRF